MCGIFGFALTKPIHLTKTFRLLEALETHQYPQEPRPVGGFGAGIAILQQDSTVFMKKVGKVNGSPARKLSESIKTAEASVLIAHVRMPSPEFMATAHCMETAQPYIATCNPNLTVVSAHNGKVGNYQEIRNGLCKEHFFDSEKIQLIDSEIIPHCYEELLKQEGMANKALDKLCMILQGSNTISLLQLSKNKATLHLVHQGKSRGLTVWKNDENEVVFCSRREPLEKEFGEILRKDKFTEKIFIPYKKEEKFTASFPIEPPKT
ncbi:MAG: hypothetical protein QHH24_06820 [Candidatus Bathyarchaeota archaeon]|nr:hypothetical protein [Candidatus Bathyarchaeota archaeon]